MGLPDADSPRNTGFLPDAGTGERDSGFQIPDSRFGRGDIRFRDSRM
jgi:hypothetical protein